MLESKETCVCSSVSKFLMVTIFEACSVLLRQVNKKVAHDLPYEDSELAIHFVCSRH